MIWLTISCDFCQERAGWRDIRTVRSLLDKARNVGWSIRDGKHYCPSCSERRAKLNERGRR